MGEAVEHTAILTAIPLEEHLIRTEDARYTIHGHSTVLENMHVVIPELVLDEESHHRTDGTKETTGVGDGVEGQVTDDVGPLVVLTHLIARRREKGEQDLVLRMVAAELFHQRASLLKLSQRGRMEPHVLRAGVYLLSEHTEGVALTAPHLTHLLVEATVDRHTQEIEIYDEVVDHPSTSIARFVLLMVSSLPKKAEISNMPGPLPSPTSARRQAFIMLPNLYSFCSIQACTICS